MSLRARTNATRGCARERVTTAHERQYGEVLNRTTSASSRMASHVNRACSRSLRAPSWHLHTAHFLLSLVPVALAAPPPGRRNPESPPGRGGGGSVAGKTTSKRSATELSEEVPPWLPAYAHTHSHKHRAPAVKKKWSGQPCKASDADARPLLRVVSVRACCTSNVMSDQLAAVRRDMQ